jgi:glycine cleavage system protein P-like pyridoxal-binding family
MAISNFFHQYHPGHELLRCIHRLAARDLTLCGSMIAPGSCPMNLNTTSVMPP